MYSYIMPGDDSSSASNTSTTNTVTSTMSSDIKNNPLNLTRFGGTISRHKTNEASFKVYFTLDWICMEDNL